MLITPFYIYVLNAVFLYVVAAGAGTIVLYEKTTTTDMNSTYGSVTSTASDEEVGTVNNQFNSVL